MQLGAAEEGHLHMLLQLEQLDLRAPQNHSHGSPGRKLLDLRHEEGPGRVLKDIEPELVHDKAEDLRQVLRQKRVEVPGEGAGDKRWSRMNRST